MVSGRARGFLLVETVVAIRIVATVCHHERGTSFRVRLVIGLHGSVRLQHVRHGHVVASHVVLVEARNVLVQFQYEQHVTECRLAGLSNFGAHRPVDKGARAGGYSVEHCHHHVDVRAQLVVTVGIAHDGVGDEPEQNHQKYHSEHLCDFYLSLQDKVGVGHLSCKAINEPKDEPIAKNHYCAGHDDLHNGYRDDAALLSRQQDTAEDLWYVARAVHGEAGQGAGERDEPGRGQHEDDVRPLRHFLIERVVDDDYVAVDGDEGRVPERGAREGHRELWVELAHDDPRRPLAPDVRVNDEHHDEAEREQVVYAQADDEDVDDIPDFTLADDGQDDPQVAEHALYDEERHDGAADRRRQTAGDVVAKVDVHSCHVADH